ncbi:MAG: hypothetical protein RMY64_36920 [Nostoc sp. DedQUE08]|uniref:hypothetical protein n=1 Tax=Nostoc sp. DedQUE08 TaxID=3075393 RepID=UPI002AD3F6E0|nr:hypothetical protein [Nostoc sp. DedQUE08]MDZ8071139.1 hypothetical protein [Nostoc sp. DedQUE08]
MPLPPNFDHWEHLQDMLRLYHNKLVRQYFKNQEDGDISKPKPALKQACLLDDNDTVAMTQLRLWLFEITVGHAQSLQAPIYGIPVADYQRDVSFKPQVKLYFRERYTIDTDRTAPGRGEITFRLMNESAQTYTRAKAEEMARDIKREFATPIFVWEKGIHYYYYKDFDRGYDLRLLVKSKTEGERLARNVLQIQGHPFDSTNVDFLDTDKLYPSNPGTHLVYGRQVKKPVKRPVLDVRFRHAQLFLNGRQTVINLVSTPESALRSVIERVNAA